MLRAAQGVVGSALPRSRPVIRSPHLITRLGPSRQAGVWSNRSIPVINQRVFTSTTRRLASPIRDAPVQKFTWKQFRQYIRLAYPERYVLSFALLCLGINAGCNLLIPYGMGQSIDSSADLATKSEEERQAARRKLFQVATALAGVFVIGSAAMFGRVALLNIGAERIMQRLRKTLFSSLTRQEAGFYDKSRTGELVNRLSADTVVISRTLTDSIASGIRRVVEGIGGVGVLFYLTPKLTALMLSVVPVVVVGGLYYGRYIRKLSKQVQDTLGSTTERAEEVLSSIRTVKLFTKEEREAARYGARVDQVYELGKRAGIYSGSFYGGVGLSANLAMLAVLSYGGSMVIDQQISLGELTSFLLYSVYVAFALSGTANSYNDICRGLGATERVFELCDRQPHITSKPNAITPSEFQGDITFQGVRFSYPTRSETPIFEDLDLRIPAGNVVAIVGSSGSGKSTILSLLSRLYDPNDGAVLLDGRDVRDLDLRWLRQQIGFVNQEPVLFSGTIRENIAYGMDLDSDSSDEALDELLHTAEMDRVIRLAAEQANAHHFIQEFTDGYDTQIGERGVTLSGGQKQRIAIARAIIKNPRILVLDEATSALDAESEYAVQQSLETVMKNRTTLIIAHRLSTVKKADSIVVLNDGQIAEQGTHDQLMNNQSIYCNLISRQMAR